MGFTLGNIAALAGFGAGSLGGALGPQRSPILGIPFCILCLHLPALLSHTSQLLCLFWACTNQDNRPQPSEWLRSISHHCDTQLDCFTDGKGQVFIPIAEVWGNKAIWEDYHTVILSMKGAGTLPFPPLLLLAFHVNNAQQALGQIKMGLCKRNTFFTPTWTLLPKNSVGETALSRSFTAEQNLQSPVSNITHQS